MPETSAREMVELNFGDEARIERLPFHRVFRAPAAQSARSFPCKSGRLDHSFEFFCERGPIVIGDGGSKADVVQLSVRVVEAEE